MSIDYSFLPYLYNEEIYLIKPPRRTEGATFRGIVFFVDYPGIATLPTKEKIMLNKIMEAVQLRTVQVSIVNIPELRIRLSTRATTKFDYAKVVFFTGKIPGIFKAMEINSKYEIQRLGNSEFLLADVLEVLDQDRNLKKILWNALKELFGVQ